MEIPCDCGYVARGADDNELVAAAQAHARDVHRMELTAAVVVTVVRSMSQPGAAAEPRPRRARVSRVRALLARHSRLLRAPFLGSVVKEAKGLDGDRRRDPPSDR